MNAFQDPNLLAQSIVFDGHPFLSRSGLSAPYVAWTALWVALVLGLAAISFRRRDL